jgi:DNA repair protein RadC
MSIYMDKFKRKYIHVKNVYVIREATEMYKPDTRWNTPEKVAKLLHKLFEFLDETREHFLSISVNNKNELIAVNVISIGSVNTSIVHPREVFYAAIADKAVGIILCHNHPSGDVSPSQQDIDITLKLVETGRIVGIDVMDHIILGQSVMKDRHAYLSMKEQGLI